MTRPRSVPAGAEQTSAGGPDRGDWGPITVMAAPPDAGPPEPSEYALPRAEMIRNLVERVERGDSAAKYRLYEIFNRGIRFQLVRQLGTADLDDKVHDTFLIVLRAILRKDLRNPERLLAYIRTVVKRQIATCIERAVANRKDRGESAGFELPGTGFDPEALLMNRERRRIMREALSELNARDREILIRFYIEEVPMEVIREEMNLTSTQFRLLKSRAKARLAEIGQRKLRPRVLAKYQAESCEKPPEAPR